MEPTADARILQTQWFVDPKHPLIETKIYYSKADNMLFYITAHRGVSTDDIKASSEVNTVTLGDDKGFEDTSIDAFNTLIKFLDKKS